MKPFAQKYWAAILIILILAAGSFARINNLEEVPSFISSKEAATASDAVFKTYETGAANSQSGFFTWLISLSFSIFGTSFLSLKITSAVIGILTILLTYIAAKQLLLFANRDTRPKKPLALSNFAIETSSLLSASLLAFNLWHISASRAPSDIILIPFLIVLATSITFYALRSKHLSAFIATAFVWGFGCYIVSEFVIFLFAFFFILIWALLALKSEGKGKSKTLAKKIEKDDEVFKIGVSGIATIIILVPLIVKGLPLISAPENARASLAHFFQNFANHIGIIVSGEKSALFNEPLISIPTAILFTSGIIYALWVSQKSVKNKHYSVAIINSFLILSLFIALSPSLLLEKPNSEIILGTLPFICIISSYGFLMIIRAAFPRREKRKKIWKWAIFFIIFFSSSLFFINYKNYNAFWNENSLIVATKEKNEQINNFIQQQKQTTNIYIVTPETSQKVPYPKKLRGGNDKNISITGYEILSELTLRSNSIENVTFISKNEIPQRIHSPAIVIPIYARQDIKELLKNRHPNGVATFHSDFWSYTIQ